MFRIWRVLTDFSVIELIDGKNCSSHESRMGYGGLVIWITLACYLFLGLFVICEKHFVTSLEILGRRLRLSEDVCGATLMAVGSSSPELFTALIGVFFYPQENPGPSTNIGSAVFNTCVIIGSSILFAPMTELNLITFSLYRDVFFCAISGIELYLFYEVITPGSVDVWESGILVGTWLGYIGVLKYSVQIAGLLNCCCSQTSQEFLYHNRRRELEESGDATFLEEGQGLELQQLSDKEDVRECSGDSQHSEGFALDEELDLVSPRSRSTENTLLLDDFKETSDEPLLLQQGSQSFLNLDDKIDQDSDKDIFEIPLRAETPQTDDSDEEVKNEEDPENESVEEESPRIEEPPITCLPSWCPCSRYRRLNEDENIPVGSHDRWYDTVFHYATWVWHKLFYYTVPHINAISERELTVSRLGGIFFVSILWIGLLTFLVVDCSEKIGNCIHIPEDIVGMTFLAIGSSLPDCISSVIVAREGKGEMAVANALGSNIFDVNICVGLAFFLKSLIAGGSSIKVQHDAQFAGFILSMLGILVILLLILLMSEVKLQKWHGRLLIILYLCYVIAFSAIFDEDKGAK